MDDVFKKTSQFYDQQADIFEAKTKDKQKRHWLDRFVEALPRKGSVLDIGCAFGRDLRTFVDLGLRVTGIDGSGVMIEKAQELVPEAELHVGDIRTLPFPDEQFDGVWASGIFVHIPKKDIAKTLLEIFRCLAKGGILYGSLYIGDSEGMEDDERYAGAAKYYSYFSVEEFRSLLSSSGFEVITFEPRKKDEYERADILEFIAKKP
ncbi:MAG: methyltransferase domain-containing protein [Candidatus Uhrbacteria bacterium]|nr:methyltransferase domain-containing protein [Candidatus Uhrbacteria bacterium]